MSETSVKDTALNFDDICFRKEYQRLYVSKNTELESFQYGDYQGDFEISYLKNSIAASGYFDFETAYGYTGPVSTATSRDFLEKAWRAFLEHCIKNKIICGLIRFNPVFDNHIFADLNLVKVDKVRDVVIMDLKGKAGQQIWAGYSQDNRNKIRQAVKKGLSVDRRNTPEALNIFSEIYYKTMDRAGADSFYYFDKNFFSQVDKGLKDNYLVLTACAGKEAVGAALVFFTKSVMYYFLSATTQSGRNFKAANLLRHEAVNIAQEKGISFINFGGGLTSSRDDSLLKFKQGFCSSTKQFYIGKFIAEEKKYNELCKEWEKSVSREKLDKYGKRFLKYRVN